MRNLPPGWLSDADVAELQRLGDGKVVLEMGAWKGRSTVVLAEVASYVVSVDRHRGIEGHEGDSLPEYLAAVRDLGNVAIVVATFDGFVPLLYEAFDLVFIDGDHDYASVHRDIVTALSVDPPLIAFHDFDFEDVRKASTEFFGEPNSLGGSIASFVRRTT